MNSQHLNYFAGLQQETQKYQNESRTFDRQRRIEEENLKNIRLTQLQLEDKLRNISNELGQEIRTKKIEEEKHVRLRQAMASDHQAIIQITSELQGLDSDETTEKTKFVKEMESGLHEIDFLLQQRENERLIRLLEGETVKSLVDTKLAAVMSEIGVGGGSSADEMNNAAWKEISATVMEGMNGILDVEERVDVALKERKELEHLVVGLRQKFAAENQNLGQMEMNSLEAKWEQKYTEDSNDMMDDVEGGEQNASSASKSNLVNSAGSAVHMELFYDEQVPSYSGPVHDTNGRNNVGYAC